LASPWTSMSCSIFTLSSTSSPSTVVLPRAFRRCLRPQPSRSAPPLQRRGPADPVSRPRVFASTCPCAPTVCSPRPSTAQPRPRQSTLSSSLAPRQQCTTAVSTSASCFIKPRHASASPARQATLHRDRDHDVEPATLPPSAPPPA
jgi:hypothetical protein